MATNQDVPNNVVDVVIVASGITGVITALKLQRAGKTCILLEVQEFGFGTTGGTTANLNTLMDTPYYQTKNNFGENNALLVAQLSRNSIEQIEQNIAEYMIACGFDKKSAYLFLQNDEQTKELEKIVESTKEVNIAIDCNAFLTVPFPFKKVTKVET